MKRARVHPLRRFRKARGLSQSEIAALTDSSKATISRIEAGADPTLTFIRKVRRIRGCSLTADDFLRAGVPLVETPADAR